MEWKQISEKDGLFNIPERFLHIHYYDALNVLFRFENSLRVFVYTVLKNKYFDKWHSINFEASNEKSQSISSISKKRIEQARKYGYLGYEVTCPIMHLTSGELIDIITGSTYWPVFKEYFLCDLEVLRNKLFEIGTIRNALAHFRPIKMDDVDLIKQNTRHTLSKVEDTLTQLFYQGRKVPTNIADDWYQAVCKLSADNLAINPLFSQDEKWVNIQMIFTPEILSKTQLGNNKFWQYQVTKLVTQNIIVNFPELCKYLTYVSEYLSSPTMKEDYELHVAKQVNLVFNRAVLSENTEVIIKTLKQLQEKIVEESDLLKKDSLARGYILEPIPVSAYWRESGKVGAWSFGCEMLKCPYKTTDPTEYWGNLMIFDADLISCTSKFPWMVSDISREELPF